VGEALNLLRKPEAGIIIEAGELIRAGKVVAYPTETLYGLGADALNPHAVEEVCAMKGRPPDKPISVIISDRKMLGKLVEGVGDMAELLMEAFWPGPLTIVFGAQASLPKALTANTGSVGVRIPASRLAIELVRAARRPVTATSANRSGIEPPASAEDIPARLVKEPSMIIDAGKLTASKPSTLVDPRDGEVSVLRKGAIDEKDIIQTINKMKGA